MRPRVIVRGTHAIKLQMNRFQKSFMLKGYARIMGQHMMEFVKSIPRQLSTIIIGFVLMVNSEHADHIYEGSYQAEQMLADNMELFGRVLICLGLIQILVMWYLAQAADDAEEVETEI